MCLKLATFIPLATAVMHTPIRVATTPCSLVSIVTVLGLTAGLRSFAKKSLCGARLSHQGVLTTVLEHTRAAYYGKNFVPQ